MAPQWAQLQQIIQCLFTHNDGSWVHWHGRAKTSLWNKLHGLSRKRRVCHISLTSYWAEQVWWSHTFWTPFCFNLKDFHDSTQVINHVLAQAAPGPRRRHSHVHSHLLNHMYTLKSTNTHLNTAGALCIEPFFTPLSPTTFLLYTH